MPLEGLSDQSVDEVFRYVELIDVSNTQWQIRSLSRIWYKQVLKTARAAALRDD
jgi:hypothetical protein